MTDKITWTNEKRKLSELTPWARNPRLIRSQQAKRLGQSFEEFGQIETIAISQGGDIYNGHQRLKVLSEKYGSNYEVEVRVSSRDLTEKEREKLTIFLHQGTIGEWDFDMLGNEFDYEDLMEWGFDKSKLTFMDDTYTPKLESPHYTPADETPNISELYDDKKAGNLINEINSSDFLSDDEKHFLTLAALRHVVFNFKKIADYYAGSSQDVQRLMEKSALIIIDYDNAVANGFVEFSKKIAELTRDDYE